MYNEGERVVYSLLKSHVGNCKGRVELFVASQLLVSNENEKSLQCAFNAALLRRPGLGSRPVLCRTSKSQLRNIVNHACM